MDTGRVDLTMRMGSQVNSAADEVRTTLLERRDIFLLCLVAALSCRWFDDPEPASTWNAVTPGGLYTCGLSTAGEAFCWGGTSGVSVDPIDWDSLMPPSAVPVRVPGGYRFSQITVGWPVCAVDIAGNAYCWGDNTTGQLGDGSFVAKRTPTLVLGGFRWRLLAAGGSHVCGLAADERVYCWGNQFRGLLGNGERLGAVSTPVPLASNLTFRAVYPTCALTQIGDAYCWGSNDYGRLGDGLPPEPYKESLIPSLVTGGHHFTSLALGSHHICGIANDARAYCWGWNIAGQLGNGTTMHTSTPTEIGGDLRWRSLTAGDSHTCGITLDGVQYCWGGNERGEFGNGTMTEMSAQPLLINPSRRFVSVTAGGYNTCGLTTANTAFCWGRGDYGQLGNGTRVNSSVPAQVGRPQ